MMNNKGSSLVAVIVAMGFIGVIGAIVLATSVMTFQMKMVDAGATKNFYETETVLNQVCIGLQEKAEDRLMEAYTYVLTRHSTTKEEKKALLVGQKYVDFMEKMLREEAEATVVAGTVSGNGTEVKLELNKNQSEKLVSWLSGLTTFDQAHFANDDENPIALVFVKGGGELGTDCYVKICNVSVAYKMNNKAVKITTDIRIGSPSLAQAGKGTATLGNLAQYGIIVEKEVSTIANNGNNVSVLGNVYGGQGIHADGGGTLVIQGNKILSRGNLEASGGGKIKVSQDSTNQCQIWVDNIKTLIQGENNLEFTQIELNGEINVASDLVMNNAYGDVKLSGNYYGYGYSQSGEQGDYGSSIAINAHDALLNTMEITNMVLSGRTTISTLKDITRPEENIVTVMQGESLSYGFAQNAYLLPGDCITYIGHNPMTKVEYEALEESTQSDKINVARYLPVPLRKYINPMEPYKAITVNHYISGQETPSVEMVYLYMNFMTPRFASDYFKDYISNQELNVELMALADAIGTKAASFSAITGFISHGNVVDYVEEESLSIREGTAGSASVFSNLAMEKKAKRNGLMSYLDETKMAPKMTSTLVGNIINVNRLKKQPPDSFAESGGDSIKAVANAGATAIVVGAGDPSQPKMQKGVVLVNGNVTVRGRFDGVIVANGDVVVNGGTVYGLIIATGNLKLETGGKVVASESIVKEVLGVNVDIQEYFAVDLGIVEGTAGSEEGGTGSGSAETTASGSAIEKHKTFTRIEIDFENWKKG